MVVVKRSGFGPRKKPMTRGEGPKRSTKPLPRESANRKRDKPQRQAIAAKARTKRCVMAGWAGHECFGDIVAHEWCHRSVMPSAWLDTEVQIPLCVFHNGVESDMTDTEAEDCGIRAPSWAVVQYGAERVGRALAQQRVRRMIGLEPEVLFWRLAAPD